MAAGRLPADALWRHAALVRRFQSRPTGRTAVHGISGIRLKVIDAENGPIRVVKPDRAIADADRQ